MAAETDAGDKMAAGHGEDLGLGDGRGGIPAENGETVFSAERTKREDERENRRVSSPLNTAVVSESDGSNVERVKTGATTKEPPPKPSKLAALQAKIGLDMGVLMMMFKYVYALVFK